MMVRWYAHRLRQKSQTIFIAGDKTKYLASLKHNDLREEIDTADF